MPDASYEQSKLDIRTLTYKYLKLAPRSLDDFCWIKKKKETRSQKSVQTIFYSYHLSQFLYLWWNFESAVGEKFLRCDIPPDMLQTGSIVRF